MTSPPAPRSSHQGTGSAAGQRGAGLDYGPRNVARAGYPRARLVLEEIRDGLYWVTKGMYQCAFMVTGQGVIAVDAPPSIGDRVTKAIRSVTDEPVTHVVYSPRTATTSAPRTSSRWRRADRARRYQEVARPAA